MNNKAEIINIIESSLGISVSEDTVIEEYGISSFDFIRVLVMLENEFSISFSNEQLFMENYKTVNDIIAAVNESIQTKNN